MNRKITRENLNSIENNISKYYKDQVKDGLNVCDIELVDGTMSNEIKVEWVETNDRYGLGFLVSLNDIPIYLVSIYEPHGCTYNPKHGLLTVWGHEHIAHLWITTSDMNKHDYDTELEVINIR